MTHSTPDFLSAPEAGTSPRNSSRASRAATFVHYTYLSTRLLALFHRHAPSLIFLSSSPFLFPLCRPPLPFPADHPSFARHSHPRRRGHRRTERAAASKLILNAEVGHLVYFFINSMEWAIRLPHCIHAFLIKGRISHPSSFISPPRPRRLPRLLFFSRSYPCTSQSSKESVERKSRDSRRHI